MSQQQERYRIHTLFTKTRFLHVEDALEIGKIRLFTGLVANGQMTSFAVHYLDVADARVLFFDLGVRGKVVEPFVDYKGSPTARDGQPLSRVLKVENREGGKVVIQCTNGPGLLTETGAVKPIRGQADAEIAVIIPTWEARKLGQAVTAYLTAWDVTSYQGRKEVSQDGCSKNHDSGRSPR